MNPQKYPYEFLQNHYIVHIDGGRFLIDTGCPFSFYVGSSRETIVIDGIPHRLRPTPPEFDLRDAFDCIGGSVDGFIGLDIVSKTALTIHDDFTICFHPCDIDGEEIPLHNIGGALATEIKFNGRKGTFILDTGAKIAYGEASLFVGASPIETGYPDYNPILKKLHSDLFRLPFDLGHRTALVEVGDNERVRGMLGNVMLIGSIFPFYSRSCLIDPKNHRLVID